MPLNCFALSCFLFYFIFCWFFFFFHLHRLFVFAFICNTLLNDYFIHWFLWGSNVERDSSSFPLHWTKQMEISIWFFLFVNVRVWNFLLSLSRFVRFLHCINNQQIYFSFRLFWSQDVNVLFIQFAFNFVFLGIRKNRMNIWTNQLAARNTHRPKTQNQKKKYTPFNKCLWKLYFVTFDFFFFPLLFGTFTMSTIASRQF